MHSNPLLISKLTPFVHIHITDFPPGMDIRAFNWWMDKGLYHILYHQDPLTLSNCCAKLEMPPSRRFYFKKLTCGYRVFPPPWQLKNNCALKTRDLEVVPQWYMTRLLTPNTTIHAGLGERLWSGARVLVFQTSGFIHISLEASLKIFTRWYLVPIWLARMYQTASTECFKDCKLCGTMLQIIRVPNRTASTPCTA